MSWLFLKEISAAGLLGPDLVLSHAGASWMNIVFVLNEYFSKVGIITVRPEIKEIAR